MESLKKEADTIDLSTPEAIFTEINRQQKILDEVIEKDEKSAVISMIKESIANLKSMVHITSKDYVRCVLRTESCDFDSIRERLTDDKIRLLHAAMGLATESGEFIDMLKKHIFYGKKLDYPNLGEELGDAMWYSGVAIDVLKTTLDEVLTVNIMKLRERYPEKFTEESAINRNIDAERDILEQSF